MPSPPVMEKAARKGVEAVREWSKLPNELYELVDSRKVGISVREAELIEERLASIINRYINCNNLASWCGAVFLR